MGRIKELKQFISIKPVNGHIEVTITKAINNRKIKQLTNIHDRLTKFEQDAVIIHVYKILEDCLNSRLSNKTLKYHLNNCNYAEVFGSPWTVLNILKPNY